MTQTSPACGQHEPRNKEEKTVYKYKRDIKMMD